MTDNQQKGKLGEDFAAEYLLNLGYTVIMRNYHTCHGEIDIIAGENDEIVFVEVKTRKTGSAIDAVEAVGYKKQNKIILTANDYMLKLDKEKYYRFDIIEVYLTGKRIDKINHIKSAFDCSSK